MKYSIIVYLEGKCECVSADIELSKWIRSEGDFLYCPFISDPTTENIKNLYVLAKQLKPAKGDWKRFW